jgi:hypothetical protein
METLIPIALEKDNMAKEFDSIEYDTAIGPDEVALIISWTKITENGGEFGEVTFILGSEKLKIDSEYMDKDFVKKLLNQMVDEAELE